MEITLQRRHKSTCPHKDKGPHFINKCKCRLWAYGFEGGRKIYFSLKTSDHVRANRKLAEINKSDAPTEPPKKSLAEAVNAFLEHKSNRSGETTRKYKRHLASLQTYSSANGLTYMPQLVLEALDNYQQQHRCAKISWHKHVEQLRAFFRFAIARKWCTENPALQFETPELPEAEEIVPYTRDEVSRILRACDLVGRNSYERSRAKAIVLLLRFTGMRISDVITLSRDHIKGDYIVRRAVKNNRWLKIEIQPAVRQALEALPHPAAAARESKMFFAGQGTLRSLVKGAERLLWSVFRISEVEGAYPHRFRHTFASELLAKGTRIDVVADLLGDSVDVVRDHYRKWMPEWQEMKDQASRQLEVPPELISTKSSTSENVRSLNESIQ